MSALSNVLKLNEGKIRRTLQDLRVQLTLADSGCHTFPDTLYCMTTREDHTTRNTYARIKRFAVYNLLL